jgi:hypothetical protein
MPFAIKPPSPQNVTQSFKEMRNGEADPPPKKKEVTGGVRSVVDAFQGTTPKEGTRKVGQAASSLGHSLTAGVESTLKPTR